ncbi:MAG: SMC family ATPase [Candidatus Methanofastidiosa archaeon]|nr:SMC family ATPase [Candidatus Methanofastidiosa archaeon]
MKIISLEMLNIRSYQHQKIDFPEGSFLLSGDIGFGKSTILLAIEFALFGLGDISASSLLRRGQREGMVRLEFEINNQLFTISRSLQKKGENITQVSGYISTNGNKRDLTPTELKAEILKILGYPKELLSKQKNPIYRYTVYTPQEEMKQILLAKREERMEILRKIFGIDRYKTIRDNSDLLRLDLKRKASMFENSIKRLSEIKEEFNKTKEIVSNLTSNLKSIKNDLDELKTKENNLKVTYEKIEKEFLDYQNTIREIAVKESELNNTKESILRMELRINELLGDNKNIDIKSELASKEANFNNLLKNISKAKDQIKIINKNRIEASKLEAEIASKKIFIEKLEKDVKLKQDKMSVLKGDYSRDINAIKKEIKSLENIIENIHLRKKGINKELDSSMKMKEKYNKRILELRIESSETQGRINNLDKDLSSLNGLTGVPLCPLCKQNISEDHKNREIQRILQEKDKLQLKLMESLDLIKKLEAKIDEIESEIIEIIIKHVSVQKEKISCLQKTLEETEIYNSLLNEITQFKSEIEKSNIELSKKLDNYNALSLSIEELLPFEKEINLLEEERHNLQNGILILKEAVKINADIQDSAKKQIEIANILSHLYSKRTQLSGIEFEKKSLQESLNKLTQERIIKEREEAEKTREVKLLTERIKGLSNELNKLEKYALEKENLERISNWIDKYFIGLMETIEKEFMESLRHQFEELFSRWLENLLEGEDLNVFIDEDFTPHIRQEGFDADYDSLSGGERTSIALAYRLALNRVINNLVDEIKTQDIIILDEPTDGFSRKQLDRVRDVLDMLGMKQVIIVSHEPEIESYVDHVLKVTKRDGVSRVEGQEYIVNRKTTFSI